MSISDHGPVRPSHTSLSDDESALLDSDAQLSALIEQALADRDFETVTQAMAQKCSIERALHPSRWVTFNQRMVDEFFGGDA